MQLEIDRVMLDYVRVTSKKNLVGREWMNAIVNYARSEGGVVRDSQFLQFVGIAYATKVGGELFTGAWETAGSVWSCQQASGAISDERGWNMLWGMAENEAKCKRIDIQVTAEMPPEWSQWDFATRLREKGRNITFYPSVDKKTRIETATVYIGSRHSERLIRVYEKLTAGGNKLLRFEVEYKGQRAENVGMVLSRNRAKMGDYLLFEMQTQRDTMLESLFSAAFIGTQPDAGRFKRVKTDLQKQAEWLTEGVLPAFARYVADSDSDPDVASQFLRVIETVYRNS